jgi:hypothetical protein
MEYPKYTKEDLEEAFKAGERLTNQEWHQIEFCSGETCGCKELPYKSFEDWIKILDPND